MNISVNPIIVTIFSGNSVINTKITMISDNYIDNNDNDSDITDSNIDNDDNNIYIDNNDDSIDININVTDNSDPSHRYVTPPTWW